MLDLILRLDLAMQVALLCGDLVLATKLIILWAGITALRLKGFI
jgi:hypothetical protein